MMTPDQIQKHTSALRVELYCPTRHLAVMRSWWTKQEKTPPREELLSDTGIVVVDGEPLAMSWLYFSNSKLGHLGFTCANPSVGPKRKLFALMFLLQCAEGTFRASGTKAVHSYSDAPGLSKLMRSSGFDQLTNHDFLMKYLEGESHGS